LAAEVQAHSTFQFMEMKLGK